jgi:hypothetical protein
MNVWPSRSTLVLAAAMTGLAGSPRAQDQTAAKLESDFDAFTAVCAKADFAAIRADADAHGWVDPYPPDAREVSISPKVDDAFNAVGMKRKKIDGHNQLHTSENILLPKVDNALARVSGQQHPGLFMSVYSGSDKLSSGTHCQVYAPKGAFAALKRAAVAWLGSAAETGTRHPASDQDGVATFAFTEQEGARHAYSPPPHGAPPASGAQVEILQITDRSDGGVILSLLSLTRK